MRFKHSFYGILVELLYALLLFAIGLALTWLFTADKANATSVNIPKEYQRVGSSDLISKADKFDEKKISYSGEAVGDIMRRGNYAWVNVSDGANAIGVWTKKDQLKDIEPGRYTKKGTDILVEGTFNAVCKEHGGDLDIHATDVTVVENAVDTGEEKPGWKLPVGIASLFAAGLMLFLTLRKERLERKEEHLP